MKTALVTPLKNERKNLGRLVESLQRQASESDDIIFVDAGSTDGTEELLREYAGKDPRIKVFSSPGAYPGKGRNVAIENTDADVIAQIDGGSVPAEDWLAKIRAPIEEGEANYVVGNVEMAPVNARVAGMEIDFARVFTATLYRGDVIRGPDDSVLPGGASVAYMRQFWERAGGFPDWLPTAEDVIFVKKVSQQDVTGTFVGDAVVHWRIGLSLPEFAKRHFLLHMMIFRMPWWTPRSVATVAVHVLLVAAAFLPLLHPPLWKVPVGMLLFMLARQGAKSLKTYWRREDKRLSRCLVAVAVFPLLDLLGILTRVTTTFYAILFWWKERRIWRTKVQEYLSR